MGIIGFKTAISKISNHYYLRFDCKNHKILDYSFSNSFSIKDIFEIINGLSQTEFYSEDKTERAFIRIGDLSYNEPLNCKNIIYLSDDCIIPNDKILNYDDIVLATIGATIGKVNIVKEFEGSTFSNNTVCLRIKDKNQHNPLFYEKLMRTNIVQSKIWSSVSQKAQPNLQDYDLKHIRLPFIPYESQCSLLEKIQPLEIDISDLKSTNKNTSDVLNQVFSSYYAINLSEVEKIDKTRILSIPLSKVNNYNSGLRGSLRWNKMQYIQNIIYSKIDCIETLGRFIQSTKNGWSPLSVEGAEGIPVLGQEHFSSNTILKIEPSKSTEQTRNNIEDFFIQKGDFFVSRGNTVDLVALASIVEEEIENDIIFPDLYIKIEFDESKVDKEYMGFLFNSFIGRLYFKYVAKGKNQTMVKVSSAELLNFRVPIPEKKQQAQIVEAIKTQLAEQKEIGRQIEEKQKQINKIIEDAIAKAS